MAVNFEKGLEEHSFWDFKGQTDYVDSWFLMGKPYLPLLIVVSYLVFVLRIGPAYMKRRPPVDLQNVLLVYNGWQVLMSSYLFSLGIRNIMRYGLFHKTCLFHHEDIRKDILTGSYWYIIAKVTELLETVFFVLRKKQSQVSFLHVYHHTFVVVMSWLMVKYAKTDDLVFVGTLNSFVHIWMYVYYGLSVFPQMARFLWWKKYLTSLQLIQFVLVMIQISINTVTSKCPPSSMVIGMALFNGFLFLYLFSDFYKKAYVKKGKTEAKVYKKNDPHINGLDSACNNFLKNSRNKWKR